MKYKLNSKRKVGNYVADTFETCSIIDGKYNHVVSYHNNRNDANKAVVNRRHDYYNEPYSDGFNSRVYKHVRPYTKHKKR